MTVCRIFYYQFYRFKNNFPSFKKLLEDSSLRHNFAV